MARAPRMDAFTLASHRARSKETLMTSRIVADMDFTKDDLKVFRAFLDQRAERGRRFSTDGKRLDGGMYLSGVATWEQGDRGEFVQTHDLGSRTAQQIHRKLRKMGGGIVEESARYPHPDPQPRIVRDFNTLDDLTAHARQEGATHVLQIDDEIHLYFQRRDGQYEKSEVWQKDGYWHTQGPGSRAVVRRPPPSAKPLSGQMGRSAAEAPRHSSAPPLRWSFDGVAVGRKGEYRLGKTRNGWTVILNGATSMGDWASPEYAKDKAERYDAEPSAVREDHRERSLNRLYGHTRGRDPYPFPSDRDRGISKLAGPKSGGAGAPTLSRSAHHPIGPRKPR